MLPRHINLYSIIFHLMSMKRVTRNSKIASAAKLPATFIASLRRSPSPSPNPNPNPNPSSKTSRYFSSPANGSPSSNKRKRNEETSDSNTASAKQKSEDKRVERTQSFEPLWHNRFDPDTNIKIHTLMLGTHPSVKSLSEQRFFAFPTNAFWWIAGDCLGFRRDTAIAASSKPYNFASDLRYDQDRIIPYEEQLQVFTSNGFAVWDIIQSCERKGSLDMDIKNETPNPIREFCEAHPSIQRIVFVNGKKQCSFFNKHFHDWWLSGALKPADTDASREVFKKYVGKKNIDLSEARIECVCALSVSPAAATYSYAEKRDFYEEYCYGPGLQAHKELNG